MPVHDLKCAACDEVERDVLCRRPSAGGQGVLPPCPKCGGDRTWVPFVPQMPSTTRREAAPELKEHFQPARGGFAQRYSKEREADHIEARRKGDLGNQAEFADVIPLTDAEEAEYQKKKAVVP